MRSVSRGAWFALLLVGLPGCNVVSVLQTGPTAQMGPRAPYVGGEVTLTNYLDMRAGEDWLAGRGPSEVAERGGISSGFHLSVTGLGTGLGVASGLFGARTSSSYLGLAGVAGRLGAQRLDGTFYGAVGVEGTLLYGIPIAKRTQSRALILCRSLTYLTFALRGSVDHLWAAPTPTTLPSVGFLVGIAGLQDSGAPSDREGGAPCPR